MKIAGVKNTNISFGSALSNKYLLKGLEQISEHGTTFTAGLAFVMQLGVRPLFICATPDVEKENKHYASASSIGSGLIKFGLVSAIALPLENAVKRIDKNAQKYLKPKTIENLKGDASDLFRSKSYKLATQMIKLSAGFLTAIPKSMMTIALIPVIMDKIFVREGAKKEQSKNVSFNGFIGNKLSKGVGKLLDLEVFQRFAKKYANEEQNIAKHMSAATDILLTTSYAYQTAHSKKIKENRKRALIYNNMISTGLTILGGYGIDRALKKNTDTFIKKFTEANKENPKLSKYIEGINIVRPALIFAGIYYCVLPMFSTYMSEKIDKFTNKK